MKKSFSKCIAAFLSVLLLLPTTLVFAEERITIDTMIEVGTNQQNFEEIERLVHVDESNIIDETVDATIGWDEDGEPIIRDDLRDIWGIQYESNRGSELIIDDQGNLLKSFTDVADEMVNETVVRWGGGSADGYNLAKMILPMKQREKGIDYRTTVPQPEDLTYGPVEFIKAHQTINPDVKFCWTISPWSASAEDNANFVHFLVDDASTTWGALRESWGIHGPVPIWGLEIGNEDYFTKTVDEDTAKAKTDEYVTRFREIAEKVEAIDPNIKLIPNVNGNSSRGGFYEWNRPIVKQLGPKYKTLAFHLYYSGYEFAYNHVWIEDLLKLCEEELGPDHGIHLAFTEHAKWDTKTCWSRMCLSSALATGHFLNIIAQRPEIPMATYHCGFSKKGVGTKWGFLTSFMDGTMQYTALNPLYKIYVNNVGDRVLPATTTSDTVYTDPESTGRRFSALVTPKGSKEIRLFMINRLPYTDFNLTFDTKNDYTIKKEITFTCPNSCSFSFSKKCEDVYQITETEKNEPLSTYHMPTKSLVCLYLESKQPIGNATDQSEASDGKVTYKGDNRFTDIENNWAAPEINLLADAGVVTGVGDGRFDPTGGVTYAEFVTMLTRAFKMDAVGSSDQIFDNVPPDAWYFKPINTMALSGFIRRTAKIEPEQPVTMRDAIKMIYQKAGNPPAGDKTKYKSFYGWFKDLTDYEQNAFVYEMENEIISKLYDGKSVLPDTGLSRAETAAVIYHAMQKLNK